MGGIIGRIFNEFAVVVTTAIVASAFVSLTLTPMLASQDPAAARRTDERPGRAGAGTSSAASTPCCAATTARLQAQPAPQAVDARGVFRHAGRHRLAAGGNAQGPVPAGGHRPALGLDRGAAGHLVRGHDRAAAAGRGGDPGVAARRQRRVHRRRQCAQRRPDVRRAEAARRARRRCKRCWRTCAATPARIAGIRTFATPVQNLRIGGRSSRAEYQFVVQGLNRPQLYEWSQKMADAMGRDPLLRRRQQRPADQRHAGDA